MYWYQQAAANGDTDAANRYGQLLAQIQQTQQQRQQAAAPPPPAEPKHSFWGSLLGAADTITTIASGSMNTVNDLNSGNIAGAVNSEVTTYNAISSDTPPDATTSALNIINNVSNINAANNTMNAIANGSNNGGRSTGGSGGGATSVTACENSAKYLQDMSDCKNPAPGLAQAGCYRVAADTCQCYINAYPGNPSIPQWQACVTQNNAQAGTPFQSNAPTIGR